MAKRAILLLTSIGILFSWVPWTCAQEGILRGPTPPLRINPVPSPPKPPSIPAPPLSPSANPPAGIFPEKGVVNPRTGEFYPGTIGGVLNPQTGEVLPKVEGGYINPKTGEVFPAQK